MSKILETHSLAIGYTGTPLICDINVSVNKKEITALIGRNGSGKSTLLKTLSSNIKPLSGEITVANKSLTQYTAKELAKEISVINTGFNPVGGLRLYELIAMGRIPYTGRLGLLNNKDREIIKQAASLVDINNKLDCFVAELSDGERQRGLIARSLAQQTEIIIMDEPFTYLDVAAKLEIFSLLKQIAEQNDMAIVLSTHEISHALRMADNIWILTPCKDQFDFTAGSADEIAASPLMDELFDSRGVYYDKSLKDFSLKV